MKKSKYRILNERIGLAMDRIAILEIESIALNNPEHYEQLLSLRGGSRAAIGNYPTLSEKDLLIADLKRENDAAFERIKELSEELVRLGFDPTAKKSP